MKLLKRLFDWLSPPKKSGCQVFCPGCRQELVGSDSPCREDGDGYVWYQCSHCQLKSEWDFDTPAPLLRSVM